VIATTTGHEALGLLVVALTLLGYASFSGRLETTMVSGPMVFVALGVLAGAKGFDLVDFSLRSEVVRTIVEATLALVLFSDASRIDIGRLRRHVALPGRLLGIGLPLTILAGMAVCAAVFPGLAGVEVALVAVILAPTDAALGQAVLTNRRVPAWVRQGLNVESGLNDGIAVPVFATLTAVAVGDEHALGREVVRQLGWGVVAGLAVGFAGAALLTATQERRWLDPAWTGIAGVLVATIAYTSAVALGGSGFIAAFCAGLAFGGSTRESLPEAGEFGDHAGQLLAAITFVIFGGALVTPALDHVSARTLLYAVASLTVIRLVPVALALIGSGAARPTVAFCGWFGPRGLASVLFLVLLIEDAPGLEHLSTVAAVVTWTVLLSIVAHGMTAVPLAAAYARWYERTAERPDRNLVEVHPVHEHPLRPSLERRSRNEPAGR
jgi:NhaP-type Na+/H+ or K+/H+ antiporter